MRLITCIILTLFWSSYAQPPAPVFSKAAGPEPVQFVTSDLDHFWHAYTLSAGRLFEEQEAIFDSLYIQKASDCLKEILASQKMRAADFVRAIQSEPDYFAKCQAASKTVMGYEKQVRDYLDRFKLIYPKLRLADIYFMFTRFYTGGQSKKAGIAIGMDFWSLPDSDTVHFQSPLLKELVRKPAMVPVTIVHELAHRNQDINGNNSLLRSCLQEGGADFIAYLVTRQVNNPAMYDFGNAHEKELWERFERDMQTGLTSYWLYNNFGAARPRDLGYWMGFKICEYYYTSRADKEAAIMDILRMASPERFLKASGYDRKFSR